MIVSRSTIQNKVMLALQDNGVMSSKQLRKYLNGSGAQINSATMQLRMKGLVEHRGYARYLLTETGKSMVSVILGGIKTDEVVEEVVEEVEETPEVLEEIIPEPTRTLRDEARELLETRQRQERIEQISKLLERKDKIEEAIQSLEGR